MIKSRLDAAAVAPQRAVESVIEPRWTLKRIMQWIQTHHGLSCCRETVRKTLRQLGFSWKKWRKLLNKANTEHRKAYVEKLKTSLAFATQGQEQIVYVDEAHIHLDTDEGYGWTVKGQRAWISSHSPNFAKVSFYGVYFYNQGKVQIHAFDKADSHNTMKVLQKIRETFDADKSITLIWDNAPYHRSVQTKQAAQDLNIRLMPLPAYSPDFMPVEHLWRWLREEVTYHRCYEHESTLIARVNVFEQSINTDPKGIADRLWAKTTLNDDEEKLRFSD